MVQDMTIAEVPVGSVNMYRLFLLPGIRCVCREGRQCSKVVRTTKEVLKENKRTMLEDISPHLILILSKVMDSLMLKGNGKRAVLIITIITRYRI